MQRSLTSIETEVIYALKDVRLRLHRYEQILVRSRLKDCESAIDSLRRRQEGGVFDSEKPNRYSLTELHDLVGVRILAFPQRRREDAHRAIASRVSHLTQDHLAGAGDPTLVLKFHGLWEPIDQIQAEIQIMPMLIGLFWEVEHSAIYKPTPNLQGLKNSKEMKTRYEAVLVALRDFEQEFERQIDSA